MKNLLLKAGSAALVPVVFIIAVVRIFRNASLFKSADLLVVAPHTAYGHTITAPDVARRLYPKKSITFLLFSDYRLHNTKLSLVWTNPRFISLPLSFQITSRVPSFRLPCVPSHKDFLRRIIMSLVRRLIRRDIEVIPRLEDLYPRVNIPTLNIDRSKLIINYVWTIGYFELIKQVAAPHLKLPESIRRSISLRLRELVSGVSVNSNTKKCVLYLRQKAENSNDYHNYRRSGSPLEDYLPAVQFLNASGYQVLVTGDVALPDGVLREFRGMLTDARLARLDPELFDLYASTEADIFVGDPGGGVWLAGLNEIPRLLINAFPYFFGLPASWVNYKTLYDGQGRLVHFDRLFNEFSHDYELTGYTLKNNSAQEILSAIQTFLQDLENPGNPDPGRKILETVPDFIWAKHAGTRICRTWLALFDARNARNPAQKLEVG